MTAQTTISSRLNIEEFSSQLYSVLDSFEHISEGVRNRLKYFQQQALLVGADYFYCLRNELEDKDIPFVYVYDERGKSDDEKRKPFDINKKLWTVGEVAAAVLIYDDEIKIIDARKQPRTEGKATYLYESLLDIDRKVRAQIFEGRILEDSNDNYVNISSYEVLLRHINNKVISKDEEIGCDKQLLRRLTVKLVLVKYLQEQKDFNDNSAGIDLCQSLRQHQILGLFDYLNEKLNGGIFQLNEVERQQISNANLSLIAEAFDDTMSEHGQLNIWKLYDFNLIPIEFISRLYEAFVKSVDGKQKKQGAYYTPPHLARLMVDELLPFDRKVDFKNFKILDPSCGSGIFIVLAYKRLITLWMLKNNRSIIKGDEDIAAIKKILRDCIYGVDIDPDALAITATSLQIELTSHVQPKEILQNLSFDNLVDNGNLQQEGFFKWYKTQKKDYDVILGNPPFNVDNDDNVEKGLDDNIRKEVFTSTSGVRHSFPYHNPATAFLYLAKEHLLKEKGMLALVMPASSFLYMPTADKFRKAIFLQCEVQKIYDFTPLMDSLWGKTKVATVAVVLKNQAPEKRGLEHLVIRNTIANEGGALRFEVDKYDKFFVPTKLAYGKERIWKLNLFGGGRLQMLNTKYKCSYPSIKKYCSDFEWSKPSNGYRVDKSAVRQINVVGRVVLDTNLFRDDEISNKNTDEFKEDYYLRPPSGDTAVSPNVLIRLNLNYSLPIVLNHQELIFRPGVLALKAANKGSMESFVESFRSNRELYKRLIRIRSAKAFVQQSGDFSIEADDILQLPIFLDDKNNPTEFPEISHIESAVWEDADLMADWLNGNSERLQDSVTLNEIKAFSNAFCEILNHIYDDGEFKFRLTRQIVFGGDVEAGYVEDDYMLGGFVWVTFEHSNKNKSVVKREGEVDGALIESVLKDDISKNGLRVNRIITYYGENNSVSFIKPNKLKYWTRSIGYQDAENVKGDMFENGF